MTPFERVRAAFDHREPDRIPYDLGATHITGIHRIAYRRLLDYLGIASGDPELLSTRTGAAKVGPELLERFKVDLRGVFPHELPHPLTHDEEYSYYTDDWGARWRSPRVNGLYYDILRSPLSGPLDESGIDAHPWPELIDRRIIGAIASDAEAQSEKGNFPCIFEDFYVDLASEPQRACYLMDRMLELQLAYWEAVFQEVDLDWFIVRTGDDLGEQTSTRISPQMYRSLVKPRHERLFQGIKQLSKGRARILFHSDGSVYPLIGDLVEAGIDALNPVQYNTANMDTARLKAEFGRDLVFWGGGIDTQETLPHGTPEQVREETRRRIEDLAPGGGFIFSQVHNIQADVPPENILAMWETLQDYAR